MMKLFSYIMAIVFLSACAKEKDNTEIIVEPPFPYEVTVDSILSGSQYNMNIGDSPEQTYTHLQAYSKAQKHTPYLSMYRSNAKQLAELKDRIPLYWSLFLDSQPSSPSSPRIYFENNKVKAIYFRDGKRISSWPMNGTYRITEGDALTTIYDKLVKISQDKKYSNLFQYLGLFEKNLDLGFDPYHTETSSWQYNFTVHEKDIHMVSIYFKNNKLHMIKTKVSKYK